MQISGCAQVAEDIRGVGPTRHFGTADGGQLVVFADQARLLSIRGLAGDARHTATHDIVVEGFVEMAKVGGGKVIGVGKRPAGIASSIPTSPNRE